MDEWIRDAILLGIAGATRPYYRGPDDQYYFHTARTMEDAPTRSHRAEHDADVLNLGLTVAGVGALIARATLPANSAGMWYNPIRAPSWARADEVVDIFRNPTIAEFRKAAANGAARAVKDHSTGDIYIWDGERALHNDVIQKLPQNGMVDSAGTLWSYDDYIRLKSRK